MVTDPTLNLLVGKASDLFNTVVEKNVREPLRYLINWGRLYSLWPVHLETACCSIEFGAASGPRHDLERFGMLEAFGSLRQCDILVVQGTVTRKMAPRMKWVYEQMPEPKWVISMGACASTGGVFDTYSVIQGVDKFIPVDVYVPGCPPRPEGVVDGLIKLQELVDKEKFSDYSTTLKK